MLEVTQATEKGHAPWRTDRICSTVEKPFREQVRLLTPLSFRVQMVASIPERQQCKERIGFSMAGSL